MVGHFVDRRFRWFDHTCYFITSYSHDGRNCYRPVDQPCGIIRLIPDSEMIVTGSQLFLSLLHFLTYYCPNSQCIVGRWRVMETLQCVWRVARMTWSHYDCGARRARVRVLGRC